MWSQGGSACHFQSVQDLKRVSQGRLNVESLHHGFTFKVNILAVQVKYFYISFEYIGRSEKVLGLFYRLLPKVAETKDEVPSIKLEPIPVDLICMS